MASQASNEGLGFPVAERCVGGEAAALLGPSGAFCQACVRRRLIDKDELWQGLVEEPLSALDP